MSNYDMIKADRAWSNYIHAANNRCMIGEDCEGWLEAHHLISRSVKSLRHDINNGVLLCTKHHKLSIELSAHNNPEAFAEWLLEHAPEKLAYIKAHKWDIEKPDYKAAYKEIIKQTERLK